MLILSLSQVRKIYYYYYYYYYIEEVELTFVISTKIEHLLLQANYLKVKYNKVTPTLPFQALFSRSKAFRLSGWCKCICGQGKVLRWLNNLRLPNSADQLDRPGISSSFNSATLINPKRRYPQLLQTKELFYSQYPLLSILQHLLNCHSAKCHF